MVRSGSCTSPATNVRSAQPSYVHMTAISATPKPPQLLGANENVFESPPVAALPNTNAMIVMPTNATTFAAVVTLMMPAAHLTERTFAAAISTIAMPAIQRIAASCRPNTLAAYVAKITAIAPSADGLMTSSSVQPKRNAGNGP